MKRKAKGMLCALAMGMCVFGTALSVYADTVHFSITVPGDVISKRTLKADSEQKFYVTGTEFHQSGSMSCMSAKVKNPTIQSAYTTIRPEAPSSSAPYLSYADYDEYYYMSANSTINGYHACGRYTP